MSYVPFLEARDLRASTCSSPEQKLNVHNSKGAAPNAEPQASLLAHEVSRMRAFEREYSTLLWCIECGDFPDPESGDVTYKDGISLFCIQCLKKS